MDLSRVLGNNIKMLMNKNNVNSEEFANGLGYSLFDVQKLCDARLLATDQDVVDISHYFGVTPDYLYSVHENDNYSGPGFMNCMHQFKKPENEEKILNIFDMYCDLKEALEN